MMITYVIIGFTVLVSLAAFRDTALFNRCSFNAFAISRYKEWWRFFTHAFIHADYVHLGMNMYVLYGFGINVENEFRDLFGLFKGELYYFLLYVGGIFISSIYSFEKHKDHSYYTAVGASGAVSAVVFSFILMFPTSEMGLIFIPGVGIPAAIFGTLYLVYSSYMAKRGKDNIGHDAHFWGAVFGFVFTIILKPTLMLDFIDSIKNLVQ